MFLLRRFHNERPSVWGRGAGRTVLRPVSPCEPGSGDERRVSTVDEVEGEVKSVDVTHVDVALFNSADDVQDGQI